MRPTAQCERIQHCSTLHDNISKETQQQRRGGGGSSRFRVGINTSKSFLRDRCAQQNALNLRAPLSCREAAPELFLEAEALL
jgi:hypothetical protein